VAVNVYQEHTIADKECYGDVQIIMSGQLVFTASYQAVGAHIAHGIGMKRSAGLFLSLF
jgi:hypothetical protein